MQVISYSTERCEMLIELAVSFGFLKDIEGLLDLFLLADTKTHAQHKLAMILSISEKKYNVFLKTHSYL